MSDTAAINRFLLEHGIRIRHNPAVSPDLCLDPAGLERAVRGALGGLKRLIGSGEPQGRALGAVAAADGIDLFPASELRLGGGRLFVVEEHATGDAGLLAAGGAPLSFETAVVVEPGWQLVPLLWAAVSAVAALFSAPRRAGRPWHRSPASCIRPGWWARGSDSRPG